MPRPPLRWAHDFTPGVAVEALPAATVAAVRRLFPEEPADLAAFLSELSFLVALYRDARQRRAGPGREPTPGEIRAAADELQRRAAALAELLDTPELGGALDLLTLPRRRGRNKGAYLHELREDVQGLAAAAEQAARDVRAVLPQDDPRRGFACDVARAMQRHTGKRPTAYCSDSHNRRGPFAALLALMFEAADGVEPGDLRKLVQAAVRAIR